MINNVYNKNIDDFHGAVLFIGSGLSADEETKLPSGMAISEAIVQKLIDPIKNNEYVKEHYNLIYELSKKSPFEIILDHHPNLKILQHEIAEIYKGGIPNRFHNILAQKIKDGCFKNIVTTNYDSCIEKAYIGLIDDFKDSKLHSPVISEASDILDVARDVIIFKIHGTCEKKSTIVCKQSQEGLIDEWKYKLLENMIAGKELVFIGYSGLDFDICQLIYKIGPSKVHWLFRESSKEDLVRNWSYNSQNVQYLSTKFGEETFMPIIGGFNNFFKDDVPFKFCQGNVENIVERIFKAAGNSPLGVLYWRTYFFSNLGFPRCGYASLDLFGPSDKREFEYIQLLSDIHDRSGLYNTSIKCIQSAEIQNYKFTKKLYYKTIINHLALTRSRLYGSLRLDLVFSTIFYYISSVIFLRNDEREEVKYLILLTYIRFVKSIKLLRIVNKLLLSNFVRKFALSIYETKQDKAQWEASYILDYNMSDAGLPLRAKHISHHRFMLSAESGFSHVNSVVGRSQMIRREQGSYIFSNPNKYLLGSVEVVNILEHLHAIGSHPELWKLYSTFQGAIDLDKRETWKSNAEHSLERCEYKKSKKHGYLRLINKS